MAASAHAESPCQSKDVVGIVNVAPTSGFHYLIRRFSGSNPVLIWHELPIRIKDLMSYQVA